MRSSTCHADNQRPRQQKKKSDAMPWFNWIPGWVINNQPVVIEPNRCDRDITVFGALRCVAIDELFIFGTYVDSLNGINDWIVIKIYHLSQSNLSRPWNMAITLPSTRHRLVVMNRNWKLCLTYANQVLVGGLAWRVLTLTFGGPNDDHGILEKR